MRRNESKARGGVFVVDGDVAGDGGRAGGLRIREREAPALELGRLQESDRSSQQGDVVDARQGTDEVNSGAQTTRLDLGGQPREEPWITVIGPPARTHQMHSGTTGSQRV